MNCQTSGRVVEGCSRCAPQLVPAKRVRYRKLMPLPILTSETLSISAARSVETQWQKIDKAAVNIPECSRRRSSKLQFSPRRDTINIRIDSVQVSFVSMIFDGGRLIAC